MAGARMTSSLNSPRQSRKARLFAELHEHKDSLANLQADRLSLMQRVEVLEKSAVQLEAWAMAFSKIGFWQRVKWLIRGFPRA